MHHQFFGLNADPFSNSLNTDFFFPGHFHRDSLAQLLHGVKQRSGLQLLTGEIGAGKSLLIKVLLNVLQENETLKVIELGHPQLNGTQFLQFVAKNLQAENYDVSDHDLLIEEINKQLLENLQHGVLLLFIVDEAQMLTADALDQLRFLVDLEDNNSKLMQLILIGQPELAALLAENKHRALLQRVAHHVQLDYLDLKQVGIYIEHRLHQVQGDPSIFPKAVVANIFNVSAGSPRLINLLCRECLSVAFKDQREQVTLQILEEVIDKNSVHFVKKPINQQHKPLHEGSILNPDTESSATIKPLSQPKFVLSRKSWLVLICSCVVLATIWQFSMTPQPILNPEPTEGISTELKPAVVEKRPEVKQKAPANENIIQPTTAWDGAKTILFPFNPNLDSSFYVSELKGAALEQWFIEHFGSKTATIEDILNNLNGVSIGESSQLAVQGIRLPNLNLTDLMTRSDAGHYYLYFGSYKWHQNALKDADLLIAQGFKIRFQRKKWQSHYFSRLYVGPFESYENINNNLNNIKLVNFDSLIRK